MSTIKVNGDYVVSASQNLVFTGSLAEPVYTLDGYSEYLSVFTPPTLPDPDFTVLGSIQISGGGNAIAIADNGYSFYSSSLIKIAGNASLSIVATGASSSATGYQSGTWGASFENDGVVQVSAQSWATGVYQYLVSTTGGDPQFVNTGQFTVTADTAYGVVSGYGGSYKNSGQIEVDGGALGTAFSLGEPPTGGALTNSGIIRATGAQSYGIRISGSGYSSLFAITNTGTIQAQHAIANLSDASLILINSGTIEGDIVLQGGGINTFAAGDRIVNTGTISGPIVFTGSAGEIYDGRGGHQTGGITLGSGVSTVYLGDDGETVTKATGTAVVLGGSGSDSITGGSGNDILGGGGGSDTLIGNAGADIFRITESGSIEVVNDFSHAQGDRIDLTAVGLNSWADVQARATQVGADTVISLGAGSLTLKSVSLSSLTAADFVLPVAYSAAQVTGVLQVTGSTLFSGSNGGNGAYQLVQPTNLSTAPLLSIAGAVIVEDHQQGGSAVGVSSTGPGVTGSTMSVLRSASFIVEESGADGSAYGVKSGSLAFTLYNYGLFSVTAAGLAVGVQSSQAVGFQNLGSFIVTGNVAEGVLSTFAASYFTVSNSGTMTVSGVQSAVGFDIPAYSALLGVDNSGALTVTASSGHAYGIKLNGSLAQVTNSGTINAEYAIYSVQTGAPQKLSLTITNSGTINGEIDLASGLASTPQTGFYDSSVTNTGAINGAVHLSAHGNDLYDGRGGTLTGGVYLGAGANTVYLGDDGETVHGGAGTAIVKGGSGADTIIGGSGNDVLDGAAGANVLTGGSGADTFTFTVASGSTTITDFSHAEGDRVDLSSLRLFSGFAALQAAMSQSGSDTVIDLGGGATIILDNVTASGLTAADFILRPYKISGSYTVAQGDSLVFDATGTVYQLAEGASLTVAGSLSISSGQASDRGVLFTDAGYVVTGLGTIHIASGGSATIQVVGAGSKAIGYLSGSATGSATFTNDGLFDVEAAGQAAGVFMGGTSATAFSTSGTFKVVGDNAVGVAGYYNGSNYQGFIGPFSNSGLFQVLGVSGALGLAIGQSPGWSISVTNTGTMTVTASAGTATGIHVAAGNVSITNGATAHITAQTAILADGGTLTLTNNGTIDGDIVVTSISNIGQISNSGTINGAVTLRSGSLNSQTGTITGALTVGAGTVYAYLGAEDNSVNLGSAGFHIVDGGGGRNTASYASAAQGVTVSLSAPGTSQNVGPGMDTLTNFQVLIGSAYKDTLTAGAGASSLTGGLGADTFKLASSSTATTITDFSHAEGDKIDLWAMTQFTTLSDLHATQSGADTVISLGSGSLTLKNVTASTLSDSDFVFFEGSYTSTPLFGAMTIDVGQTRVFKGSNGGFGAYDLYGSGSLTVRGALLIHSGLADDALSGIHTEGSGGTPALTIAAGGSVTVSASGSGSSAYAFYSGAAPAAFENDGTFSVSTASANSVLTAITLNAGGAFANTGVVTATSQSGATGIFSAGSAHVSNTGSFTTSGANQTVAFNLVAGAAVANSGTITATSSSAASYGIVVGDNVGGLSTVLNAGTITAQYAVNATGGTGHLYLVNTSTGMLNGDVVLGFAADNELGNAGAINGHVSFLGTTGPQFYDGRAGSLSGGLSFASNATDGTDYAYLGNDGETVTGGSAILYAYGGAGADSFVGGSGNAFFDGGAGGNDRFTGGTGINTVEFVLAPAAVTVSLATQGVGQTIYGSRIATLTNIQSLVGSTFADHLTGDAHNNFIDGGGGDDVLDGGGGTNTASFISDLTGGVGVNVSLSLQGQAQNTWVGSQTLRNFQNLTGSTYDDVLEGDSGNNRLDGYLGRNTVTYAHALSGVNVSLALQGHSQDTVGAGTDFLANFQNLAGSAFDDTLEGDGGANVLNGGAGTNLVSYAHAASGVTVSLALQGQAQDTVGAGSDTLANFRNLTGSAFGDRLSGDSSDNVLTGGGGADVFGFHPGGGHDTIADFSSLEGDKLDLSGFHFTSRQAAISHAVQSGQDTVFTVGSDQLTVKNMYLSAWTPQLLGVPVATHDFDGQGYSGLVFRDPTGQWGYAAFTPFGYFWRPMGASTASYGISGTADFNGDGVSDILFREASTGNWGFAQMNGSGGYAWQDMGGSTQTYGEVAVGDFNGDGTGDIIFREQATGNWGIAQMHGTAYSWLFEGGSTQSYSLAGAGDFNGDRVADVLFRDNHNGDWGFAQMNSSGAYAWQFMGGSTASYSVVGTGDFNGDGIDDILFRDNRTGDWGYAQLHGTSYAWLPMGGSTASYAVASTGDYNGDGVADITFREASTGNWGYAAMHGTGWDWHFMGASTASYGAF